MFVRTVFYMRESGLISETFDEERQQEDCAKGQFCHLVFSRRFDQ